MMSRHCIQPVLLAAAALAVGGVASAAPPRISHLTGEITLDDRDRDDISTYGQYWCASLENGTPDEVDRATEELLQPFKAVKVESVFRLEYAHVLLPKLEPIIAGMDTHRAINGLLIAGRLGTPKAVDLLLEHASSADEPDLAKRLWAAVAFPLAVEQGVITERDVTKALREFERAASRETEWLVLRKQLQAIASVDSQLSRELQISVIEAAAQQMKKGDRYSQLMQAIPQSLVRLREEYLNLIGKARELEQFGTALAPVISDLCTVAEMHWDSAQEDDEAREAYGQTIQLGETLLTMIDAQVRPHNARPRADLGNAWQGRQKPQFADAHKAWIAILSGPPYKK